MSKKATVSYAEITNIAIDELQRPDGRRAVVLLLKTKPILGDVSEIEVVLTPDLAVRHGKALVEAGSALQD